MAWYRTVAYNLAFTLPLLIPTLGCNSEPATPPPGAEDVDTEEIEISGIGDPASSTDDEGSDSKEGSDTKE